MFTGIVEEKGTIRYIQLTGESGVLAVKAKKVLEGTKIGDIASVGWIYRRCNGRDNPKEQSWKQQGRKQSKSGACDGCRWQIRRTYRKRPY